MEKEIINTQKYTITWTHYSDGTSVMNRKVENLSAYELLGILHKTCLEICDQISGKMSPPTEVKRRIIKPKK